MDLAQDPAVRRQLTARLAIELSADELVAATRIAIVDATDFDDREINYNFNYDHAAYAEIHRNLTRLVKQDHLQTAMDLSLELMKAGSYQVEMSDEGLMTDDIEECLMVVTKALRGCNLSDHQVATWCSAMLELDCLGFICTDELRSLQSQFDAS